MSLSRRTFCLRSAIALAAVGTAFGALAKDKDDDKGKGKNKKSKNDPTGTYKIEIRGYLTGSGSAVVSAAGIKIDANVKDENGRRGTINLPVTKISKNRFTGQGTAMNLKVTINGRIDPPAGAIKVGRITATYATQNGRYGRASGEQQ